MKKFLVFLLVLGLATATQAEIIGLDFTVNGEPQPVEITLAPSQTVEIDLELEAGSNTAGYVLEWEILGGRAEFIWSGVTYPIVFEAASKISGTPTANKIRFTGSQILGSPKEGPGVIMMGLILHCLLEDPTPNDPTIMTVYTRGTTKINGQNIHVTPGVEVHRLIIHQVPEPATLMLLGLGSLFLLRRKK